MGKKKEIISKDQGVLWSMFVPRDVGSGLEKSSTPKKPRATKEEHEQAEAFTPEQTVLHDSKAPMPVPYKDND